MALGRNITWLFAERLISLFIRFITVFLIARAYQVEDFGLISSSLAFFGLFIIIAQLGLKQNLIKECSQNPIKAVTYTDFSLKVIFVFSLFLILFSWLAYFGFYFLNIGVIQDLNIEIYTSIITSLIILSSASIVLEAYFESELENEKFCISAIFGSIIFLAIISGSVSLSLPIYYIAIAYVAEKFVIFSLLGIFYIQKKKSLQLINPMAKKVKIQLIKDSFPLLGAAIAIYLYMKIDILMLDILTGLTEVGIYAGGAKISELFYIIPIILGKVVFPKLALQKQRGGNFWYHFQVASDIFLLIAVPLMICLIFTSDFLVNFILGINFTPSIIPLKLHLLSLPFVFIGTLLAQYCVLQKLQGYYFWSSTFGLVVNVVLNLLLIPGLGATGAAIATVVSYSCQSFLFYLFFAKTYVAASCVLRSLNYPVSIVRVFLLLQKSIRNKTYG